MTQELRSTVVWVIGALGRLQFCHPKNREMPIAPLSHPFLPLSPTFLPLLLTATQGSPHPCYTTVFRIRYLVSVTQWVNC